MASSEIPSYKQNLVTRGNVGTDGRRQSRDLLGLMVSLPQQLGSSIRGKDPCCSLREPRPAENSAS